MIDQFIQFLNKHIELSDNEVQYVKGLLDLKTFKKKEYLLKEGEVSNEFYFNLEGCVRLYYNVNGEEKSAFFFSENQFVSSYESYVKQIPSKHNLQAIERTTVVVLDIKNAFKLLDYSPKFELLARLMMEEELIIYQTLVSSYITLSPEERYSNFIENNNVLLQRLPQHYIASYLGVSPESLSRIKKRIAGKDLKS